LSQKKEVKKLFINIKRVRFFCLKACIKVNTWENLV
jgi:hypothetical protein